jgi:hypothetical protein
VGERQRQAAIDRDITHAYLVSALSRMEKLPALETLLVRGRATARQAPKQTPAQQRAVLQMLSEKYGLSLRTGRRVTHG